MKKRMPEKDSSNQNRGKKREREKMCRTNRKWQISIQRDLWLNWIKIDKMLHLENKDFLKFYLLFAKGIPK